MYHCGLRSFQAKLAAAYDIAQVEIARCASGAWSISLGEPHIERRADLKSFDSRVYSVNDYREWDRNKQLVLSPRFQRRDVWSETARSYLMDTIVRGLPIPKIFIRQVIDPATGVNRREVVDGQQRLRTILSYVGDGFMIRRGHNQDYGGVFFSQLDEEKQVEILNYELSTDLLVNMSDTQVLDVFSRLNAHAVVLNEQEKINASHFGEFKKLVDSLAHQYFEYWVQNKILRDAQVVRMADVSLTADLVIAMCDGVQGKKQIRAYYDQYEKEFSHDTVDLATQFNATLAAMSELFPEGFANSEFHRIHLHYSLFTAVYHLMFGLKGLPAAPVRFDELNIDQVRQRLDRVESIFTAEDSDSLDREEAGFLNDSRRATTDASVRERRADYLVRLIAGR